MNKVITINLNGNAYQVEEAGFALLNTYLQDARTKLANNPDQDEIIRDLEQAIAEKCKTYLNARKTVILTSEVEQIIKDMGPVESTDSTNSSSSDKTGHTSSNASQNATGPKRLYRIREGALFNGVCTGIAAYFNLDVTLVRIIFVLLVIFTSGVWVLIYFIMSFVIPVAITPDQKAQAFGTDTITAQNLVDRAKQGYKNFTDKKEWNQWKQNLREQKKQWKYNQQTYYSNSPFWELAHSIMGLIWILFILFCLVFAYVHIPAVHSFFDMLGVAWQHLMDKIVAKFNH